MTRYVESLSTSNRMQKTEKRGHGMIWRFSTGFCNFSRYKILCCTAAPMQKIAVVLVVNMSLAWHKKLKM